MASIHQQIEKQMIEAIIQQARKNIAEPFELGVPSETFGLVCANLQPSENGSYILMGIPIVEMPDLENGKIYIRQLTA